LKITPTVWFPFIVTVQLADGAPFAGIGGDGAQLDEKPNTTPDVAVAVRVTVDPSTKSAVQDTPDPQLMPTGVLLIVPAPCPTGYTDNEGRLVDPMFGYTARFDVPNIMVPSVDVAVAVMFVTQRGGTSGLEQLIAVARPDELIVATSTSEDCQVTESVMSWLVGLALYMPMAKNWAVSPTA